jgi:hypothetical protein
MQSNTKVYCIRLFAFAFSYSESLPIHLIDLIISALGLLARMKHLPSITVETVVFTLDKIIDSMLDERLSPASPTATLKLLNKVRPVMLK